MLPSNYKIWGYSLQCLCSPVLPPTTFSTSGDILQLFPCLLYSLESKGLYTHKEPQFFGVVFLALFPTLTQFLISKAWSTWKECSLSFPARPTLFCM